MKKLSSFIILTIIVIALSMGLAMSVFAHSIEAALTVPARLSTPPSQSTLTTAHGAITPQPAATANATVRAMASATPIVMNVVLAQDTFQRADQIFWGMASDGQTWGGDAATVNVFTVVGQTGQVAHGQGAFNATLGPIISDGEIAVSGSMNQFRQSNFGAVLRWRDPHNWYKAYIDGTNLVILKNVAAMGTRLGAVPFPAVANVNYTLRFQAIGTTLSAKVWPTGQTEPPGWQLRVTDMSLQNGYGGLRIVLSNGASAKFIAFKETTVMNTA